MITRGTLRTASNLKDFSNRILTASKDNSLTPTVLASMKTELSDIAKVGASLAIDAAKHKSKSDLPKIKAQVASIRNGITSFQNQQKLDKINVFVDGLRFASMPEEETIVYDPKGGPYEPEKLNLGGVL